MANTVTVTLSTIGTVYADTVTLTQAQIDALYFLYTDGECDGRSRAALVRRELIFVDYIDNAHVTGRGREVLRRVRYFETAEIGEWRKAATGQGFLS